MAGIYIHIPFCKQACHYCDFHFSTSLKKKDELLLAMHRELQLRKHELGDEMVETIYFGGGTPSMLNIEELNGILTTLDSNFRVIQNPEVTLEVNPDDLIFLQDKSKSVFEDYLEIGINRLSIGIQSFFEEDLKLMNRAHTSREAETCITEARAHFEDVSIDLIYGIPGLSDERWLGNIEKALSFDVPHISSYALTVEPKTALKKFIEKWLVSQIDDVQAQRQFNQLVTELEKENFVNYEISNFGKPGFFSENNTAYWKGKPYLGIGPSAHSYDGENRGWNVRNNSKYISALSEDRLPIEYETLSKIDRYNEFVMTGLRTIWGVPLKKVAIDFGQNFRMYLEKQAEKYIKAHLLYIDNDTLLTSKKGKFLVDGIAADLFMLNLKE